MIDISKLKVGDKVHYVPDGGDESKYENGMVKEIPDHTLTEVRVVYHCNGDWENFTDYTGALTRLSQLRLGWFHGIPKNTEES